MRIRWCVVERTAANRGSHGDDYDEEKDDSGDGAEEDVLSLATPFRAISDTTADEAAGQRDVA